MLRINVGWFYDLRAGLESLWSMRAGQTISDVASSLYAADAYVTTTIENRFIPLRTSVIPGGQFVRAIREVLEREGTDTLTQGDLLTLAQRFNEFEVVLRAELAIVDAYSVAPKGIYSTTLLAEKAEVILPEEIRDALPEVVTNDVRQAGKCLAFEVSTAAAFHILRATETVIRDYIAVVTGKPVTSDKSRSWGAYITVLEKCGGDEKIILMLKQMKDLHRNPIMHPEVSLDVDEAIVIFGLASSAMTAMVKDKQKRLKKT